MSTFQLNVTELEKKYNDLSVLKQAEYTFDQGRIYGLLGKNGAGKTTLFNCIGSKMDFDGGHITLKEQDTWRPIEESDVGFVYSEPLLPEFLTGYEFLKFFISVNANRIMEPLPIDAYFDLVKMDAGDRHRLIKGYSHGMKNKMQLLTVLITKPPVILLDEPLTSFDVVVALEIKNLLKSLKKDHIIIFSTHILQLATDLCDDLVMLHQGKLTTLDHDLLNRPEFEANIIAKLSEEDPSHV